MNQLRLHTPLKVIDRKLRRAGTRKFAGSPFQPSVGYDTYVEVVVRRFGLDVVNHCGRGVCGVSRKLAIFAKAENVSLKGKKYVWYSGTASVAAFLAGHRL
jgi:hypothetical protein